MSVVQAPAARPSARSRPVAELAIVLVAVALGVAVLALVRDPPRVAHLGVENRAGVPVEVSVSPDPGGDALALGLALPHRSLRVDDVLDQGDRWVFAYRTATCAALEQSVTRDELAAGGWVVEMPGQIGEALTRGCRYRSPLP